MATMNANIGYTFGATTQNTVTYNYAKNLWYSALDRPKTNLEWLDDRVNELRVKL